MRVVIDSSVWISMFSDQDNFHARSKSLILKIVSGEIEPVIPTLAVPEICGFFARNFGPHMAMIIEDKLRFWIEHDTIDVKELDMERARLATDAAIRFALKGADAVFVSLAKELKAPILTFDEEVKKKAGECVRFLEL